MTCENQRRADERIPILLNVKAKHKGIMVAPFIGKVSISKYLKFNQIEQVIAGGENYDGSRVCKYEWVKALSDECKKGNVTFCFIETGTKFEKNSKLYTIKSKKVQSNMAYKSGLSFEGMKMKYKLNSYIQENLFKEKDEYKPYFRKSCYTCGSKIICNGCSNCKNCER